MGPLTTTPRTLLRIALSCACLLALATPAHADEGRAVSQARSYPRGFATYDDLVSFGTQIAIDQAALDAELARTGSEAAALGDALTPLAPFRGGILWSEAQVKEERGLQAAQHARLLELRAREHGLVAAGALVERPDGPWRMPVAGELTQRFGPTDLWLEPGRVWGGVAYAHFHGGVDIAAAWGAPVVAPADGRVAFVGRMGDGAEVVVLAHEDGRVSLYAHLADAAGWMPPIAAGDWVRAGDRIGSVGTTGMVTGPHVHWSVYARGELVDPLTLTGG